MFTGDRWIAPWQIKKNRQTVSLHTEAETSGDRLSPCILVSVSHTGLGLIEYSHDGKRQATFHVRPSIRVVDYSSLSFV